MNSAAKAEYKKHPALSLKKFMSGYGENEANNPAAIWDLDLLVGIAHKMTMVLMGIVLSALMALYLAALEADPERSRNNLAIHFSALAPKVRGVSIPTIGGEPKGGCVGWSNAPLPG